MPTTPDVIDDLPNGWKKLLRTRNRGASVGGKDVYIICTLTGLRFRSTRTLAKHIQKYNLFATVDPNVVNFERSGKMKPNTRIHKDFIAWIESKGSTNPKFLQPKYVVWYIYHGDCQWCPRERAVKRSYVFLCFIDPALADSFHRIFPWDIIQMSHWRHTMVDSAQFSATKNTEKS